MGSTQAVVRKLTNRKSKLKRKRRRQNRLKQTDKRIIAFLQINQPSTKNHHQTSTPNHESDKIEPQKNNEMLPVFEDIHKNSSSFDWYSNLRFCRLRQFILILIFKRNLKKCLLIRVLKNEKYIDT